MKRYRRLICAAFIFLLFSSDIKANENGTLVFVFSGSANGILESCHCPGNLFGGLVKRATFIDSVRKVYPEAMVYDLGDFLPALPDSLKEIYVVKAMETIEYDAVALGDQDLVYGFSLIKESSLPLISASIYQKNRSEPLFPPYKSVDKSDYQINLIALIDSSVFMAYADGYGEDFILETAEESWIKFRDSADLENSLIVVLSHMGYVKDIEFIQRHPEIDLIFSGHSQVFMDTVQIYGKTLLMSAGKNGEYAGMLKVKLDSLGDIADYSYEMIPLDAKISDDEEISELTYDYNDALRMELKRRAIAAGRKYRGTDFCAECHQDEYRSWIKTAHARAIKTLELINAGEKPSCIECHSTGYGFPGGYDSLSKTAAMAGVGCEECHRIANNTEFVQGKKHRVLPVIASWCTKCHIKPHVIEFNYEEMIEEVKHDRD